jgi:hypothetical protein
MAAAWKLNTYVHVVERDSAGGLTGRSDTFGPADEVPGWAVIAISNPDVWESHGNRSALPSAPDPESGLLTQQHAGADGGMPADVVAAFATLRAEAASLREQVVALAAGGSAKEPTPGSEAPSVVAGSPPPRGGAGSGAPAWREYAASKDVEVAADASREDCITALDAAGVPTGPTE